MFNSVSMFVLADAVAGAAPNLSLFYGVLALGFVAAVTLGSIAFYNSKRPVGWEDKERPKVVPKVGDED
nr:hypothetical protein [Petrachloros mirabilis]